MVLVKVLRGRVEYLGIAVVAREDLGTGAAGEQVMRGNGRRRQPADFKPFSQVAAEPVASPLHSTTMA